MELPSRPADNVIRILGIDPGSDTLGTAILDVDIDTYKATVVYGGTFTARSEIEKNSWLAMMRTKRDERLGLLEKNIFDLMLMSEPLLIGAESPFVQRGKVSAYEALVECQQMLRNTVWKYSPALLVRRIDPITVKNYVGVSHRGTDKSDMHRAVVKLYENNVAANVDLSTFDEHTIDAIAVAHVIYRKLLLGEIIESTRSKKFRKRKKGRK